MRTGSSIAKIASKISNPSSLTNLYHSIELGVDTIRCCSEFGNLELLVDPTGLKAPALVDTKAILAVATSLPSNLDIELEEKDNVITIKLTGKILHDGKPRVNIESVWQLLDVHKTTETQIENSLTRSF